MPEEILDTEDPTTTNDATGVSAPSQAESMLATQEVDGTDNLDTRLSDVSATTATEMEPLPDLSFNASDPSDKKLDKLRQIVGSAYDVDPQELADWSHEDLVLKLPDVMQLTKDEEAKKADAITFEDFMADGLNTSLGGNYPKLSKVAANTLSTFLAAGDAGTFGLVTKGVALIEPIQAAVDSGVFDPVALSDAWEVSSELSKTLGKENRAASLIGSLGGGFIAMKKLAQFAKVFKTGAKIINVSDKFRKGFTIAGATGGAALGGKIGYDKGGLPGAAVGTAVGALAGGSMASTGVGIAGNTTETVANMALSGTLGALDAQRAGGSKIEGAVLGSVLAGGAGEAASTTKSLIDDALLAFKNDPTSIQAGKTLAIAMKKLGLTDEHATQILGDLNKGDLPFESANERIQSLAREVRQLPQGAEVGRDVAEQRMSSQQSDAESMTQFFTASDKPRTEQAIASAPEDIADKVAKNIPDTAGAEKTLSSGKDVVRKELSDAQKVDYSTIKTPVDTYRRRSADYKKEYDNFDNIPVSEEQAADIISEHIQIAKGADELQAAAGESGIDENVVFNALGLKQADNAAIATGKDATDIQKSYQRAIAKDIVDKGAAEGKAMTGEEAGKYSETVTVGQLKNMYKDLKVTERELINSKKGTTATEADVVNEIRIQKIQKAKEDILGQLNKVTTIKSVGDVLRIRRHLKDIQKGTISGNEKRIAAGQEAKKSIESIDNYLTENFPEQKTAIDDLTKRYSSRVQADELNLKLAGKNTQQTAKQKSNKDINKFNIGKDFLGSETDQATIKEAIGEERFNKLLEADKQQTLAESTITKSKKLTDLEEKVRNFGGDTTNLKSTIGSTSKAARDVRKNLKSIGVDYDKAIKDQEGNKAVEELFNIAQNVDQHSPVVLEDVFKSALVKNESILRSRMGDPAFEGFKKALAAQRKKAAATEIVSNRSGNSASGDSQGPNFALLNVPKIGGPLLSISNALKSIKVTPEVETRMAEAMFSGDIKQVETVWKVVEKSLGNKKDVETLNNIKAAIQSTLMGLDDAQREMD
jgi:hypothetical protein